MIHNTKGNIMTNVYTENLNDIITFDRERALAIDLLKAWGEQGLPIDFYEEGVKVACNRNSGNVFLVNEDYQCAMMNGDKLESHYTSPYDGHEGFLEDLLDMVDDNWHEDDIEWLDYIKSNFE